jgi:UDP-N-acetylmuramoyl-tripeptide--D-alanyl-D-alanine ligase
MAELGHHAGTEHRRIAERASALGIRVVAVGTDDYGPAVEVVEGVEGAVDALGTLGPGDAVLVKGSRVAGLEVLAQRLLDA